MHNQKPRPEEHFIELMLGCVQFIVASFDLRPAPGVPSNLYPDNQLLLYLRRSGGKDFEMTLVNSVFDQQAGNYRVSGQLQIEARCTESRGRKFWGLIC